MKKLMKKLLFAASAVLLAVNVHAAGDAAAGKAKAAVCSACHGANGVSPTPIWPNLAGQKELYLIKQIKAFRDGDRNDPSMSPMVKPLSDQDIDNLAAYYSSLSCE